MDCFAARIRLIRIRRRGSPTFFSCIFVGVFGIYLAAALDLRFS